MVKIAEAVGVDRDEIYSQIHQKQLKLKINIPVKFRRSILDIIKSLSLSNSIHKCQVVLRKCPKSIFSEIKELFHVNILIKKTGKGNYGIVNSSVFYKFLTTFFNFYKRPKLRIPLTHIIYQFHNNGINLKKAIIIPFLQTDGTSYNGDTPKIIFYGKNKILHKIMADAMFYSYTIMPTTFCGYYAGDDIFYTSYEGKTVTGTIEEIRTLAGSTKTSPARGQSIKEYMKEKQPHLRYLNNASKSEKLTALRIWASSEGCIGIRRDGTKIYPILTINCAHPSLLGQLKQIAEQLNIRFSIKTSKSIWSGFRGLYTSSLKNFLNFLRIGGFIKEVFISKNSKYHQGITKDVLLLGILEYVRQRKMTNKWPREIPIEVHHHNINKIINNKEYRTASYYISLFSLGYNTTF